MIHKQVCSLRLESKFNLMAMEHPGGDLLREQLEATFSLVLGSDLYSTPSQRGQGRPEALRQAELRSFVFPLWTVP